jgi:YebC/PmpR family DNA-binding regulatory protein
MSGHSKWSQIKRQKGAADARRGALFTKVTREIVIAAREGGPDADGNYKLRLAVEKARSVNMPQENIKRAIERASGPGEADRYEEIAYEGYGPGGVAILVETATDNRNRTAADIRSIFSKHGGQLAGAGSVAWQFEPRGIISVVPKGTAPDDIALLAIDAGAADVDTDPELVEVYVDPPDLERVRGDLEGAGLAVDAAEISMVAKMPMTVEPARARQNLRLVESLEEHDDVQRVTANFEIPEEVFAEAAAG